MRPWKRSSRFRGKADIATKNRNFGYGPVAEVRQTRAHLRQEQASPGSWQSLGCWPPSSLSTSAWHRSYRGTSLGPGRSLFNSLEEDIWLKSPGPRSIKLRRPRTTKKNGGIRLTILPLTPDLWPAFEDLFGKWGASNGCWCMYWRIGGAYRGKRSENKEALREIVKRGSPPGLLAFDGDLAVGWCQVTPRDALPWLDRMWWFRPVDDMRVWAISCFFVRRGYRRQGVMSQLIVAALKTAKRARASALEAYPIDTSAPKSTSNTFTGTAAAFTRAGFQEVARCASARPIMRHDLKAIPR